MPGVDPLENVSHITEGEAGEATEVGQVALKLLNYFEAMDLPESLKGLRLVVMLDTEDEGTIAGSPGYETEPPMEGVGDLIENLFTHAAVLMKQVGLEVNLLGDDEFKQMFSGGAN